MNDMTMIQPEPREDNLTIFQAGHEACESSHSYGPRRRGFFILHILQRGKGVYTNRGKTYSLSAGDVFLIMPNDEIYYAADPTDPYEYYWLAFQGVGMRELLVSAGFITNDVFVKNYNDRKDELLSILKNLITLKKNSARNDLLLASGCYAFLGMLIDEHTEYENRDAYGTIHERVNMFLDGTYAADFGVDALADYVGLHRSSIYRYFIKQYGKSPTEYILDYKLTKAYNAIKSSELNIKQIALGCGFNDLSYFGRAFKRKFGVNPTDLKKKYT